MLVNHTLTRNAGWRFIITVGGTGTGSLLALGLAALTPYTLSVLIRRKCVYMDWLDL